jgi:hypothetical protein
MGKSELATGQYSIVNVGSKNTAELANSNENQKVQASGSDGSDNYKVCNLRPLVVILHVIRVDRKIDGRSGRQRSSPTGTSP